MANQRTRPPGQVGTHLDCVRKVFKKCASQSVCETVAGEGGLSEEPNPLNAHRLLFIYFVCYFSLLFLPVESARGNGEVLLFIFGIGSCSLSLLFCLIETGKVWNFSCLAMSRSSVLPQAGEEYTSHLDMGKRFRFLFALTTEWARCLIYVTLTAV